MSAPQRAYGDDEHYQDCVGECFIVLFGRPWKRNAFTLHKNLLNSVACVEKASFINEHYSDSGIFGLTVGGPQDLAK
jgi:hypothetical protein